MFFLLADLQSARQAFRALFESLGESIRCVQDVPRLLEETSQMGSSGSLRRDDISAAACQIDELNRQIRMLVDEAEAVPAAAADLHYDRRYYRRGVSGEGRLYCRALSGLGCCHHEVRLIRSL